MYSINFLRFENWQCELTDWQVLFVKGSDALSFFHGQTTNDLLKIQNNKSILTARLNHSGKVQSFFYFAKCTEKFYLIIPKIIKDEFLNDINKFIIMDDVEISETELKVYFTHNVTPIHFKEIEFIHGEFYGIEGVFTFEPLEKIELVPFEKLDEIKKLNAFPAWNESVNSKQFVNESRLNELAVSYKKGCFLGQETVAKIENNRGPAYYPFLIKLDSVLNPVFEFKQDHNADIFCDNEKIGLAITSSQVENDFYIHARISREFRVENKKINFSIENLNLSGTLLSYPLFKNKTRPEISNELYESALKIFNSGNIEEALNLIDKSIKILETPDNLEMKGVMLGRIERFDEAIECMNKLTALDPTSVMAHTNKSLFLMRLGKIAEAEEEKSLATVKSFEKFGEEARLKKQIEEEKRKKNEEILSREKMFLKVLEIDSEDLIANFGMADINFIKGNLEESLKFAKNTLSFNENYSQAYLLIGKIYELLSNLEEAKSFYEKGIVVASKKGEMMPANEMQARLNKL